MVKDCPGKVQSRIGAGSRGRDDETPGWTPRELELSGQGSRSPVSGMFNSRLV